MKQRFFTTGQSFGLSNRTLGFLWKDLMVWQKNSGEEFVVKHLKKLKMITLGSLQVSEKSSYLKSHWGRMISYPHLSLRGKLTMIDFYLSYRATSPTPGQLDKFYSSLGRPKGKRYHLSQHTSSRIASLAGIPRLSNNVEILFSPYSHQKSIPSSVGKVGLNQSNIGLDIVNFVNNPGLWDWWERHRGRFTYGDSMTIFHNLSLESALDDYQPVQVGEIQYIQEGGYKLRAIANPNLCAQRLLDPLKDYLFKIVGSLDEDCTFDQGKGISRVKQRILLKEKCYCYDLSDATNNLPYTFTRKFLEGVHDYFVRRYGWDNHIVELWDSYTDLFDLLVQSEWLTPDNKFVRFGRGQPLGVGPSFALLALTHHMVMWECDATPGSYVILGDDIVIFEEKLAARYKEYMTQELEVPISEDKSIISDVLAEFAGKVITSNRVLSKYRWDPIRATNVIDVLRYHGTNAIAWVPDNLKSAAVTISSLPRHLGGLGWTVPHDWNHLFNEQKYQSILSYIKEEPDMTYVSKIHRVHQAEKEILSVKRTSSSLMNPIVSPSNLNYMDTHPWYNVRYTKGVPGSAEDYYMKANNPKAPSSSSLVRRFLQLD